MLPKCKTVSVRSIRYNTIQIIQPRVTWRVSTRLASPPKTSLEKYKYNKHPRWNVLMCFHVKSSSRKSSVVRLGFRFRKCWVSTIGMNHKLFRLIHAKCIPTIREFLRSQVRNFCWWWCDSEKRTLPCGHSSTQPAFHLSPVRRSFVRWSAGGRRLNGVKTPHVYYFSICWRRVSIR